MSASQQNLAREAAAALARWLPFSETYWYPIPGEPGLGCFGTGYDQWGVQTNQKYLAAMAVAATDPAFEPVEGTMAKAGLPRERALERALATFRYSLATHKSGTLRRTDGSQWGRTWISALGIERMMHGVDRLGSVLTDEDRAGIDRVLASEADLQLSERIRTSKWNGRHENRPESNIWNGAICARAALRLPDHPHAGDWTERAHLYWINGISLERDADDETVVEGKTVRARHIGANFFPHFALDHHGYLNLGYSVICLSNVAMMHYACAGLGVEAPASLYHHARELWEMVRRFIAPDGRLLRIGGDTRLRYSYCQDYLLPVLVFAAGHWEDPHALDLACGLATTRLLWEELLRVEYQGGGYSLLEIC
jgi:hypothetical protein